VEVGVVAAGPLSGVDAEDGGEEREREEDDGEDCKYHHGARLVCCDFGLFAREVGFDDVGLLLLHVEEFFEGALGGDGAFEHRVELVFVVGEELVDVVEEVEAVEALCVGCVEVFVLGYHVLDAGLLLF